MTTNKQLQEWLSRFPDAAEIIVLTSEECKGHWDSYIDVCKDDLKLPDVTMGTLKGYDDFENVVFDVKYDYDKEIVTEVRSIQLGKAHND